MEEQSNNKKNRGPRYYASAEEQELARLKEAINRTDKEKFLFLMQLMKLQLRLKQGTIEHRKT
jgi:hypothetical protein